MELINTKLNKKWKKRRGLAMIWKYIKLDQGRMNYKIEEKDYVVLKSKSFYE